MRSIDWLITHFTRRKRPGVIRWLWGMWWIFVSHHKAAFWSYPRNMDTGLSEVLVFKLFRTEAATPTVPPPPIVITFDIIKHRCPHYFPADKVFSMDTFHFQRMKEAFHAGIIVAATFCAHTSTQIMPLQLRLIICWTVLASTVRVNDNVPGPTFIPTTQGKDYV